MLYIFAIFFLFFFEIRKNANWFLCNEILQNIGSSLNTVVNKLLSRK